MTDHLLASDPASVPATHPAPGNAPAQAGGHISALLTALAFLVVLLLTHPFVQMGVNDDWSYIRSAQLMAQHGRFMYVGWAVEPLGWQILLGALFIKVLGFSFTAARLSNILIGACSVYLMQRIMRLIGLTDANAAFGTLAVALSPVCLPVAPSFMTDIPGFFAILVCLYSCIRALKAPSISASLRWIVFAAVSNILLGTVRQISWLGVLVLVPATGWILRKSKPLFPIAIALWLIGIAAILEFLHWFSLQPYSLPEKIGGSIGLHAAAKAAGAVVQIALTLALLALPVTIAFPAADLRFKPAGWKRRLTLAAALTTSAAAAIAAISIYLRHRLGHLPEHYLAPWLGNTVTTRGTWDTDMIGTHPLVLNAAVRILFSFLTFFSACACLGLLNRFVRSKQTTLFAASIPDSWLLTLFGSFMGAYGLLLLPRAAFHVLYDRYLIPPLFLLVILLLLIFQTNLSRRLSRAGMLILSVFTLFAMGLTHDFYALGRARVAAAARLQNAGIPRTAIEGGFEFDGWTQLEQSGYINQPDITNPPGAFHPPARYTPASCRAIFDRFPEEVPAVVPRYALSYDQSCFAASAYGPVAYRTWLPPYDQKVYIRRIP